MALATDLQPVHICALTDLADGELRPIEIGGKAALLARNGERVFALARRCLHQGADLSEGIISRGSVLCPQHGWRFLLDSGQQDCAPQNCLTTYAVAIEDGDIFVDPRPRWLGKEPS